MPQAPVDDAGAVLFYEDSGAPPNSTEYTTIVLVHGMIFHSGTFHRLLPHAHTHNLRLVLLNMRDYPNSSPLTPADRAALSSTPAAALRGLAHQLAAFMAYFVRTYEIPERTGEGKGRGGIVLSTWSFSNTLHLALLADAHLLPRETNTLLRRYWRRSVLYDPALGNIGAAVPPGVYSPLRDPSLPSPTKRIAAFSLWVSSYFPPVPPSSIPSYTLADLLARQAQGSDNERTPSVERMSEEERKGTASGVEEVIGGVEAMRAVPRTVYEDNTRRALWEPDVDPESDANENGEEGRMTFPELSVLVLWFDSSIGDCIWATKLLHDAHAAASPPPRSREVEFVSVSGCNHLAHWDEPERIVRALAEHV
ncbi:hypothetical protein BDW22DRAFT_1364336 [Trametopsis cervina]|nr:hypothetical protein BDW22DRAFT_1364336 [Trametopsis cervina]